MSLALTKSNLKSELSEVFHNPSDIFQSVLGDALAVDTVAFDDTVDTVTAFDDTLDLSGEDASDSSTDLETKQFIYRPLSRPEITLERFWDFRISRRAEELMEQMLKEGTVWIQGSEGENTRSEGDDSTHDMDNNNSTLDMAQSSKQMSSTKSKRASRASKQSSRAQKPKVDNVLRQDEVLVCPKKNGIELLVYCF